MTPRFMIKWTGIFLIFAIVGLLAGEIAINASVKAVPPKSESLDTGLSSELLYYLEYPHKAAQDNITVDNDYVINAIIPTKMHLDMRYDCSDFMTPTLTRLIYKHGDTLQAVSPQGYNLIKETLLDFKYWMTEPGRDSMCYWSENHQILFAVAEYLVAQKWPNEIFTNDGKKGSIHFARAESRINSWMEHRFYYGFSEFNSTNYFPFNFGPMSNFIQFSNNPMMVERMKMVMDLALYELASNMYQYTFMAPSGRAYVSNKSGIEGDKMRKFTDYIWSLNDDWKDNKHRMLINFISMAEDTDTSGHKYYEVPEVILDIGRDDSERMIKSSSGLDVSELEEKGYVGPSDDQIMMQLGMEAFTNPEVIRNTINYIAKHNLSSNYFLKDFKYFNNILVRKTELGRVISKNLNPMTNGIAIQRANLYTYATPYYQLANVQNYHPGNYGTQEMLNFANFTENAVAFTMHPAKHSSSKNVDASPGYWTGYGRAPSSAQHENILMMMYQLPKKSGFLEFYDVPQFTHTYLPEAFYDEVIIDGRHAFARVGNAYLSLTGANNLEYADFNLDSAEAFRNKLTDTPHYRFDLIQNGRDQYWIYEMGDATAETFAAFQARIKSNSVTYNGSDLLTYTSGGSVYSLEYAADFKVNDQVQDFNYKRFDSPYSVTERETDTISFSYNSNSLTLDWLSATRTVG